MRTLRRLRELRARRTGRRSDRRLVGRGGARRPGRAAPSHARSCKRLGPDGGHQGAWRCCEDRRRRSGRTRAGRGRGRPCGSHLRRRHDLAVRPLRDRQGRAYDRPRQRHRLRRGGARQSRVRLRPGGTAGAARGVADGLARGQRKRRGRRLPRHRGHVDGGKGRLPHRLPRLRHAGDPRDLQSWSRCRLRARGGVGRVTCRRAEVERRRYRHRADPSRAWRGPGAAARGQGNRHRARRSRSSACRQLRRPPRR